MTNVGHPEIWRQTEIAPVRSKLHSRFNANAVNNLDGNLVEPLIVLIVPKRIGVRRSG